MSRMEKIEEELGAQATSELVKILGQKWQVFADTNIGTWDFYCHGDKIASGESEIQALKRGLMWAREQEPNKEYEIVDHPQHYGGKESKHEAISRAGKKPNQDKISDLKKARWYLDRYISDLEANNVADSQE